MCYVVNSVLMYTFIYYNRTLYPLVLFGTDTRSACIFLFAETRGRGEEALFRVQYTRGTRPNAVGVFRRLTVDLGKTTFSDSLNAIRFRLFILDRLPS